MGVSIFNTGYDLQDQIDAAESAIAIVSIGSTHAAITSGQYVYVREHGTLAEGLYRATANIAANGTLSSSNVTAVSGGGLNALNSKLADKVQTININTSTTISLSSLCSSSANEGSKNFIMFSCVNNLATDMPQSVYKYGSGFIIDAGYFNTVYYFGDDSKLYIGNKAYNSTSWIWHFVSTTAIT